MRLRTYSALVSTLGLAVVAFAVVNLPAGADTLQDFDVIDEGTPWTPLSLGPPPPCLPQPFAGGPTEEGRFLRIAHGRRLEAGCDLADPPAGPEVNSNSIAFDRSDPGEFSFVVADFDLRLSPATGRADGIGFALLDTTEWGISGGVGAPAAPFVAEEPSFKASLGIGFDIFESTDLSDVDDNHVSIHFDETRLQEFSAREVFDLGGGQWFHVRVLVRGAAGSSEVSVIVTPCHGRPVVLVDDFLIPGMSPYESRAYFAARSGGLTSDLEIDNVRIQFLSAETELFSFAVPRGQAVENGPGAEIMVLRAPGGGAASVDYATEDLTAVAGVDYEETTDVLTFAAGETMGSFSVPLIDNAAVGTGKKFRVVLQNPSSGTVLGGPSETVVEIVDDETARVLGHWSPVQCWPIVPIHLHALPDGQVLAWSRVGEGEVVPAKGAGDGIEGQPFDRIRLWDPATRDLTPPSLPPHDVFCSGHSFLADGRLLVTGGNIADSTGLPDVASYDPVGDSWTDWAEMNAGRWYPTNVTLASGDVAVESGETTPGVVNTLPQVLDVRTGTWRDLTCAETERPVIADLYPRLLLAPDGRLFKAGPDRDSWFLDTAGCGDWVPGPLSSPLLDPPGSDPGRARTYGGAVLRDTEVLLIGGADPPTAAVDLIDLADADPAWRSVGALNFPRRHLNATALADGDVLVTGGTSSPGFNDGAAAVLFAEVWDPLSESWSKLAPMATKRVYHSTAVLLPDARVLVAGGGQPNADGDIDHADVEIFSPPYLFNGSRPTILSAPDQAAYGDSIDVETPDLAAIVQVTLVRLGSTTHAYDQNQRLVGLSFSTVSAGLSVQVPADPKLAPPGDYMLFLIDDSGTPSEASVLRLGFGSLFADGFESGDVSAWSSSSP